MVTKKLVFILIFLIALQLGNSQELLKVTYAVSNKLNPNKESLHMSKNINEAQKQAIISVMEKPKYYELITSFYESTYKIVEKISNDLPNDDAIIIKFAAQGSSYYRNIETNNILEEKNVFNKQVLIKDSLQNFNWIISRENDQILNYDVRKAISIDSTRSITAWYTPKIPIKSGPSEFWGLPGLILKLEVEQIGESGMNSTFEAQNIEAIDNTQTIVVPSKGELISKTKYKEFMKEQFSKMKEMRGQGVDLD